MNFPRLSRFTIGGKIDRLFLETIEYFLLAGQAGKMQKYSAIQQASVKFDTLKFFMQIAWEMKLLDNKKYIRLFESLSEIGKMIGGWQKRMQSEAPPK